MLCGRSDLSPVTKLGSPLAVVLLFARGRRLGCLALLGLHRQRSGMFSRPIWLPWLQQRPGQAIVAMVRAAAASKPLS